MRVRQLAALLRIAVALDAGETQVVRRVDVKIQRKSDPHTPGHSFGGSGQSPRAAPQGKIVRTRVRHSSEICVRPAASKRKQCARRNGLLAGRSAA